MKLKNVLHNNHNYVKKLFMVVIITCLMLSLKLQGQSADTLKTGTTWQISKELNYANHQYTDVPVYNCNGSMALFTEKKGNFYISKSLTSSPIKINLEEKPKGKVEWDKKKPEIIYYLTYKKGKSLIHSFNVITNSDEVIYITDSNISEISPTHPDGDHLLLAPKDQENSIMEVYSLSSGKSLKIPMDVPLHRVRFTTSPDLTIYVNRSAKPKTSWLVNPYTCIKRQVYQGASTSPNWRLGGMNFCFYGEYQGKRQLLVLDTNGTVLRSFPQLTNHHLSWSPDGKYIVTDVEPDPKNKRGSMYPGWVCVLNYETGEIRNIVEHGTDFNDEEGDKYSAGHPHPQLSPDATKVIYNSTKLGIDHPQVFVSLVKLPECIEHVALKKLNNIIKIDWEKPKGVEIQKWLIYRVNKSGKSELAGSVELPATTFSESDKSNISEYRIVAQEYSGLTSNAYVLKLK